MKADPKRKWTPVLEASAKESGPGSSELADSPGTAAKRDTKEAERLAALEVERTRYAAECAAREAAVAEHNQALETLRANLGYGAADAIEECVSLVFASSAYPVDLPVERDFEFDPQPPSCGCAFWHRRQTRMPSTNAYKYAKSSDEITSTSLSQKACNDRYAGAVHQVALRSLHEVFEADRHGQIKTISLEVGTETIDPATGKDVYVLFPVATGAERQAFLELDFANVVPIATLGHLGASVSNNPFGRVAADGSGVRRSRQTSTSSIPRRLAEASRWLGASQRMEA